MAIGEAGTISENTTTTGEAISVTFAVPLDDPVIVLMATDFGGNKFALRVIDVQTNASGEATGFTFTMDEWENHDGPHPRVEDINWIAVEEGTHILPDGRLIEARHSNADGDGEAVGFTAGFTDPPVVLTTVASDNDTSHVDSDPYNITSSGFDLIVEEAESQTAGHGTEQVGWIAIEGGNGTDSGAALNGSTVNSDWATYSTGDDFTNPITVAETQTRNDTDNDTGTVIFRNDDAAADTIQLRFEEDTSVDGDTGHANETVGIVTFEEGEILCFTSGTMIATPHGARPVEALAPGDPVITRDHGVQYLRWTCRETLALAQADPKLAPVTIPANAFGPGLPGCDTHVSPQHRLLFRGAQAQLLFGETELLVPAKALFAANAQPQTHVTYVHLLFDAHEIIIANDMPMESFHPGDMMKSALADPTREELFAIFPDLRACPTAWGPTARTVLKTREAKALAA